MIDILKTFIVGFKIVTKEFVICLGAVIFMAMLIVWLFGPIFLIFNFDCNWGYPTKKLHTLIHLLKENP